MRIILLHMYYVGCKGGYDLYIEGTRQADNIFSPKILFFTI